MNSAADYGPVRQFDSLDYSLRHLCRDIALVLPVDVLAQPRGTWVSLMTPSAQRRRGIAPNAMTRPEQRL